MYIVVCVPAPKSQNLVARVKNCSREQSSIVRHFIHTMWKPVFKKYDVKMPEQCPLHFSRDVFTEQELAKLHYRVNLWTCGICGKSFYREPYLDLHIATIHTESLVTHDHAVCYADFCDVFRCHGYLQHRRRKRQRGPFASTLTNNVDLLYDLGINVHREIDFIDDALEDPDIDPLAEGGGDRHRSKDKSERNALVAAPPRHVLRALDEKKALDRSGQFIVGFDSGNNLHDPYGFDGYAHCDVEGQCGGDGSGWRGTRPRSGHTNSKDGLHSSRRRANLEKVKRSFSEELDEIFTKAATILEGRMVKKNATDSRQAASNGAECDPEAMQATQDKCTKLIHDCISPLLVELSDVEYIEMEGLLNRQLCWYLNCERHNQFLGTASNSWRGDPIATKASYVLLVVLLLSLAAILALVYYLVWICF